MSRRPPNPAADRAAHNQQTLKSLVKLEGNKSCADCKRNKHPRWASWNLGVFVCIRCSGIHRGMGTHISRVKSVDLDAWTDEQMQPVLRWGNTRANRYWEAKLAPGHVPSEAKIENFIRTKYESKRWVMDGPMPDPSTLDGDGDEDVPLGVVQEKQKQDRATSTQTPSSLSQLGSAPKPAPKVDLFGDEASSDFRPSAGTKAPQLPGQPPHSESSKPAKSGESLLGLDFFGSSSAQVTSSGKSGNAGTAATYHPTSSSRPDLKQSILSLYASTPRQPAQSSQAPFGQSNGSGNMPAPAGQTQQQSLGGLHDAFSGLNFSTASSSAQQRPEGSPLPPYGTRSSQKSTPAAPHLTSSGSVDHGLFDSGPKIDLTSTSAGRATASIGLAGSGGKPAPSVTPTLQTSPTTQSNAEMSGLFDFSSPTTAQLPPKQPASSSDQTLSSVFNLSASNSASSTKPQNASSSRGPPTDVTSGWSTADPWSSNDAWSNTDAKPAPPAIAPTRASPPTANLGWASSTVASDGGLRSGIGVPAVPALPSKISADEDFGSWSSAPPMVKDATGKPSAPSSGNTAGGLGGNDDLFSNVWE